MKQPSLIFLTGFSGSGKSTIGPLLANSLGFDFVDLDQEIEHAAGKSINRIFAEDGEAHFRELEATTLQQMTGKKELVVSLGGGVLQNDRSFSLIISTGTLVYLHSSPLVLAKRLSHKTDRPLMKGHHGERLSREEIEQKILALLEQREPRYKTAQITVETDNKRIGSTVEELTRKIERYIRRCEKQKIERNAKKRQK
ncbi:shikimate kinase [Prosthecochloris sp. N3]|uniref:Shikimate kinase n=1 Tax=Prosthecochloris ethylica TaxID=2743976 RepID=A0ABR9XR41_9CHLB|nr:MULTISPECIES: shikimate kinase [Prosthecochloris]MEC9486778.1 shikimate kinase [Prosthecochloris sp.]MBF0585522.1 shikimate kinase [Prosthecochloris ethylica]MBF0636308.1 shikimate kinase [Prosthecochloris ethylica]NUK46752.1 shikimate kinase [Prosthecochloris ethylica]RNA64666.1 shikimate kinase [Prosthecochloris sp. ZM_2]